jgi:hypothetical protein
MRRLAAGRDLAGHEVRTVPEMGWAAFENGDLLALAERDFDVFLTVDRNLSFQQNVPRFNIAVVILHAATNRLSDLRVFVPKLLETLPMVKRGETEVLDNPGR